MSKRNKGKKAKKPVPPYQPELSEEGFFLWQSDLIKPNPRQPRKYFAEESMVGLRKSIARMGILNPLTLKVINKETGEARLVDGERRFRCAQELKLEKVPVFLSTADQADIFRESVVLNFCREEMTEIETARALKAIMDKYGYNQTEMANLVGKSNAWVSNMLKFLKLNPKVADMLQEREITPNIAIAVARFPEKNQLTLVIALQDESSAKGRPLTPQEASTLVTKYSERLSIKPVQTAKSKEPIPYPKRIVTQATRAAERLHDILFYLENEVSMEDLEACGGENILLLLQTLQRLQEPMQKAIDKVDEAS